MSDKQKYAKEMIFGWVLKELNSRTKLCFINFLPDVVVSHTKAQNILTISLLFLFKRYKNHMYEYFRLTILLYCQHGDDLMSDSMKIRPFSSPKHKNLMIVNFVIFQWSLNWSFETQISSASRNEKERKSIKSSHDHVHTF